MIYVLWVTKVTLLICKEVKKGISKLKSGKSNEPDLKLNEFMKNSVANMVLVIEKNYWGLLIKKLLGFVNKKNY
jgi:hypothetical protein